ncbi:MAG: YdcF family protein [Patescibacteria group bacterium]|jgi:hypothetical protein
MNSTKVLFILGGGLVKKDNKWRTTNFKEGDKFGASGDRLRVVAGSCLYKNNSEYLIITSGGKGQYKNVPNSLTVAEVMRRELLELGVLEETIIKEEESSNTWEQLQQLKKIIQKENFIKIKILSSRYHLPRVRAMIEVDGRLNEIFKKEVLELVSAEEILIKHNENKWKNFIEKAYSSEAMKKRITLEKQGIKQIKNGTYSLK